MRKPRPETADDAWPRADFSRVPYSVFTDEDIYRRENQRIFRGPVWNYLCMEIELPAAGDFVTTSIKSQGLLRATDIAGRVVVSFTRGAQRIVAIAFTDVPDLGDGVTADFFRVFNRREDLRRNAAPGSTTLSALVLNAEGVADGVIDLKLRDHSDKGIGFVVDNHTDAFMRDGASLALPLPDRQQAVCAAQVRRRDAHDDTVHYGCTFDGAV